MNNNMHSKFFAFLIVVLVILVVVLGMTIYQANELAILIRELLQLLDVFR